MQGDNFPPGDGSLGQPTPGQNPQNTPQNQPEGAFSPPGGAFGTPAPLQPQPQPPPPTQYPPQTPYPPQTAQPSQPSQYPQQPAYGQQSYGAPIPPPQGGPGFVGGPGYGAPAYGAPGYMGENTSGQGPNAVVPPEIANAGFNWGAFFFSWIWGAVHSVKIAFVALGIGVLSQIFGRSSQMASIGSLLSLVGLAFNIWLGMNGNKLAWQNRRFESIEQFRAVQRTWSLWSLGCFLALLVFFALIFVLVGAAIFGLARSGGGTPNFPR